MEIKDILPAVIIIAAAIIGVSFIVQVLGVIQTNVETIGVSGESYTFSLTATSLTFDDIVASSETLTCGANALTRVTDYTISNSAGSITGLTYPRTTTGSNFTSSHDANVTLTEPRLKLDTLVVYNCTDDAVWITTGNYTAYAEGNITVLGTGDIADAEEICYNTTWAYATAGDTCSIDYTYNPDESGLAGQGATAMASFGNWWTILIVVLISVIVIGLVLKLKGRNA